MKIAVFYYSQTGQAFDVAKAICKPIENATIEEYKEDCVVYKQILPLQEYPFPWDKNDFFDTFPETRLGMPPSGIKPIDFSDINDADIAMVVGQSWFLSPSLPLQSFFSDTQVKNYLNGRNIIFVNACRNMWLKTYHKIKEYICLSNGHLIGHIVLQDDAPNLISVITIVRWLMQNKKAATWLLPSAGISDKDMQSAPLFGKAIQDDWHRDDLQHLQQHLLKAGAIKYKPSILFIEKTGHRMFGFWAKFIRQKGSFRNPRRRFRNKLFYGYLLFVLFCISPFAQLFFYLTYPLRHVKHHQYEDCHLC